MNNYYKHMLISIFLTFSSIISADDVTIDFEDLKNLEHIQDYYNGGQGSLGSSGPDYGITFDGDALVIIDSDDGGTGNFANEKSPGHTIGFFLDSSKIVMNIENGFTEGFSFWYSSDASGGDVIVYPNPDGGGNAIDKLHLEPLGSEPGGGDPNGTFNRWAKKAIAFNGTAKSIVFQGVANKIAFDLITLSPTPPSNTFDISLGLEQIIHTPTSPIADTFSIYFKDVKSDTVDIPNICNNFIFKVEKDLSSTDSRGATQVTCHDPVDDKFSVDFKIKSTGKEAYFENYNTYICKKTDTTNCKPIENIHNFSVYGTQYNVEKDAFSFENGDWTEFLFKGIKACFRPFPGTCDVEQSKSIGLMRNLVDSFKEFVPKRKRENLEEELIGFKSKNGTVQFSGICHGLALSSIADYNNNLENSSWGESLNISLKKEEISTIFHEHWTNKNTESAKPFSKLPYNYKIDDLADMFHSLGKINYYFITQPSFSVGGGEKDWVGTYQRKYFSNIIEMSDFHKNKLKVGNVSNFSFDLKYTVDFYLFDSDFRAAGHSIIATQLIKYNDESISFSLHDNNIINELVTMKFNAKDKKFEKSGFIYDKDISKEDSIYKSTGHTFYNFKTYVNDTLFVYGKEPQAKTTQAFQADTVESNNYAYSFTNHIEVTIFGGELQEILNANTQQSIPLLPVVDNLEKDKAYLLDNLLMTKFYLPKSELYHISLQKFPQYPAFEVYAKIPNSAGEVEIINYENIFIKKDDATLASFLIGNGNNDKDIKREGGSDLPPDYDETFDIAITSVTNTNAIVLPTGINLHWTNPETPNFKEVVLLRKQNERPENITDGVEIYRGSSEQYIDTSGSNNAKYHYAFFAIAQDGSVSEAEYVFVDTFRYTLYGTVSDINGSEIKGTQVVLWNFDKSSIISSNSSDKNGLFTFNDLTNGTYRLVFTHDFYDFASNELQVNIQDMSLQVNNNAVGTPLLAVNVNPVIKVGETEAISWDGMHIDAQEAVDIMLYHNQAWEMIATSVPFDDYSIAFIATEAEENAKIKVSLSTDANVYAEKEIAILGDGEPPVDNIPGDFDADDDVDKDDLNTMRSQFGSNVTNPDDPSDLNKDGIINVLDYRLAIRLCTRPRCATEALPD